jgi:hypothetical protein
MTQVALQRLVIEMKPAHKTVIRVLYQSPPAKPGPNPGTKARRREVTELARSGLTQALKALESEARADVVGTSGYDVREDILDVAFPRPDASDAREAAP